MYFLKLSVTDDLGHLFCLFFFLQSRGFVFLLILTDRSNAVRDQDSDQNSDRLEPLRLSQEEQDHLDDQRHQQDHNHRVLKPLQNLLPQRIRRDLRQRISAMFTSALFDSLG